MAVHAPDDVGLVDLRRVDRVRGRVGRRQRRDAVVVVLEAAVGARPVEPEAVVEHVAARLVAQLRRQLPARVLVDQALLEQLVDGVADTCGLLARDEEDPRAGGRDDVADARREQLGRLGLVLDLVLARDARLADAVLHVERRPAPLEREVGLGGQAVEDVEEPARVALGPLHELLERPLVVEDRAQELRVGRAAATGREAFQRGVDVQQALEQQVAIEAQRIALGDHDAVEVRRLEDVGAELEPAVLRPGAAVAEPRLIAVRGDLHGDLRRAGERALEQLGELGLDRRRGGRIERRPLVDEDVEVAQLQRRHELDEGLAHERVARHRRRLDPGGRARATAPRRRGRADRPAPSRPARWPSPRPAAPGSRPGRWTAWPAPRRWTGSR